MTNKPDKTRRFWCSICGLTRAVRSGVMCPPCCRSYDKANARDNSLIAGFEWAADRARRGMAQLMRKRRGRV